LTNFAYVSLLLFIFSIPWELLLLLPGLGTGSRLMGMVVFPLCLIAIVTSGRISLPWPVALLAAFVALAAISLSWTYDVQGGVINLQTYAQLLLMTWAATQLIDSETKLHGAFLAYVVGSYVAAMATVHAYVTGVFRSYGRYTAEEMDPNDAALRLAVAIAMAGYLAMCRRGWWRLLAIGFIPLGIYGVLLSASRAGFLAMLIAASLPVLLLLRPRHFGKAVLLGLAGFTVVWVVMVNYVPESVWNRIGTIGSEITEGSFSGRISIWSAGLDVINEAPIFGVGISSYDEAMERMVGRGRSAHNGFLAIAAEHGVVGLVLVVATWALVGREILSMATRERRAWFVILAVLLVAVMSINWEMKKISWLLAALALVHARYARPPPRLTEVVAAPDLASVAAGRSVRAFHRS
jgi:O-antigen ligase